MLIGDVQLQPRFLSDFVEVAMLLSRFISAEVRVRKVSERSPHRLRPSDAEEKEGRELCCLPISSYAGQRCSKGGQRRVWRCYSIATAVTAVMRRLDRRSDVQVERSGVDDHQGIGISRRSVVWAGRDHDPTRGSII